MSLVASLVVVAAACSGGSDDVAAPSGESWCSVVAASNSFDDEFDALEDGDSGGLKDVLDKISGLGDRFRSAAPDEIKTQVDTYAAANDALVAEFVDAGYDTDQLDPVAVQEIIAGVSGVDTEIDVYTVDACGESLGPDDT